MKTQTLRKLANPRGWAYGLFWTWNIIFLAFMSLGFAPQVLPDVLDAVRAGEIPSLFLVFGVILTIIPAVAVILGVTLLRKQPARLFALGYGVEGPLMLILAVRFFAVRDATPAVTLLLSVTALGIAVLVWQILDQNIDARHLALTYLRVAGLTLLLAMGLYASVWVTFYAVPLAVQGIRFAGEIVREMWRALVQAQWQWLPFTLLGGLLAIYTATLFIGMPVAIPILYTRAWRRGAQTLAARHGWPRAVALTLAVLVICTVSFVLANRQPQHQAFALLETPPATLADAQSLLKQQETIRAGLLNAYLAPFRYISAVGEVRHVSDMYVWAFNMSVEQARQIQYLYELVAHPLLYEPVKVKADETMDNIVLREEPAQAARLYETFFDTPILDGERETIVNTVRSTWSGSQAEAAWLAVDDREVLLLRQEITVAEHGDWADIELREVYQNQTLQRQEVVYYFSLPESAVITGVWLGNNPDRSARYAFQVAPRGAAQAVYQSEVRRNMDPALVEQIGPRQYRLRVFPVEAQRWLWESSGRSVFEEAPPLYVWLTWRVLISDGAWALPRLAEKRNVYWDATSVRLVNGQPMRVNADDWLPASVPATAPAAPAAHRVDFPGGQTVLIRPVKELPQPAGGLRLAVVLDRSRSMVEHADEVKAALAQLAEAARSGSEVDVYLTASTYRGEPPSRIKLAELDPDSIVYYGGQNAAELLAQYAALHTDQVYDAVIVLTDGSGYKPGSADSQPPPLDAPIWMVQMGGDFPVGYDDATLQAIQASGGGAAGSVTEALARFAVAGPAGQNTAGDVIDGYEWLTLSTDAAQAKSDDAATVHRPSDDFAALAARRVILAEMRRQRGALDKLEVLDHLHAVATEHGVVTPYSSMIVLVEARQEYLLDQLEAKDDRFQREYEAIGETAPLGVTGVPEPEEWLLLLLAGGLLAWYVRTGRLAPKRVS